MAPQSFGPYRLEGLLGRGGMGEVHRAYDTEHRRTVALKLLSGQLAADRDFQERFRREAFLTASLTEPHVIPIHRYGEIDGQLFLDMRLVDGEGLDARLERAGALPPAQALGILEQIAAALDAAHAAHLVHRDVKPSNILLTGRPDHPFAYLVDFGIARSMSDVAGPALTQVGSAVGTFDYMAPERFLQQPITPAVDVYALSCVLYECLTGRRPFSGDGLPALMFAHLGTQAPSPSALNPQLPPALDDVLARGLAKDPAHRPPSAGALIDDAWEAVRGQTGGTAPRRPAADPTVVGVPAPPTPPPGRTPPSWPPQPVGTFPTGPEGWRPAPAGAHVVTAPPRRRSSAVLVALIAAAVLAVVGLSVVLWQTMGDGDPTAAGSDTSTGTTAGSAGQTSTTATSTAAPDGGTGEEVAPDPAPVPAPSGDEYADGTAQNCFNAIIPACDRLFSPDVPPAHATYGSTCGGRAPETRGACLAYFLGEPEPPTGLGNDATLDALAADCFDELWEACDELFFSAEGGSFYADYGERCGGRLPPPLTTYGDCAALDE